MAPADITEAGPQVLAWKLLHWLRQRGYELPGEDSDWYLVKPALGYRQKRRSQEDIASGLMAWYLSYVGDDEGAIKWSGTFGGEMRPQSVLKNMEIELEEVRGHRLYGSSSFYAGEKVRLTEKAMEKLKPRMKTIKVYACTVCNYRIEDDRKDFEYRFVHRPCGDEAYFKLHSTHKVEVSRKT